MGKIGATLVVLGLMALCLIGSAFYGAYMNPVAPKKQGIKIVMDPANHGGVKDVIVKGKGKVIKPGEK